MLKNTGKFYIIEVTNPNLKDIIDCVNGTEDQQRLSIDKSLMLVTVYDYQVHACLDGVESHTLEEILIIMKTGEIWQLPQIELK